MKPEEALEILRKPELPDLSKGHIHTIGEPKRISMSEYLEARKIALEALEKQIPKKPIESEFTPLICPDCEAKIILGQRYCENCGQKINWEE